eukprot:TRINITY_DN6433_c0_g1_i1.p1 TRINITY_DN6433_c0_g1~~TRINITY_DN6433_c0_g1_i1.p1  ORF type:complete len:674 (+),score=113.48 TRINITY_DN6433_c0_g1_i1:55-2022(+)
MTQHSVTVHGTVTGLYGDGDSVVVVMRDKGVRVHKADDKDREWPVKTGCQITSVCSHKFGNVVAQKRYTAAIHPDHLVTWSTGFDKGIHLAPGIHVGSEVSHIIAPQVSSDKGFLRTQAVVVLCKGAGWLHIYNPYTTELAGPLEDPFEDGVAGEGGEVLWAACGVESDGEWYGLYVVRSEEPGVVRGYRVMPRSFKVTSMGKVDVGAGFRAMHLEGGSHWVAVNKNGAVLQSPVDSKEFKMAFSEVPSSQKIDPKDGETVHISFTDDSVLNVASCSTKGTTKVQTLDLSYGTQSGRTQTFNPNEGTEMVGVQHVKYTTLKGVHWISVNDKLYHEEADVGAKTLAGAMMKSGKESDAKHAPVIVKLKADGSRDEIIKALKAASGKTKVEKVQRSADVEKMLKNNSIQPSETVIKNCFEVAVKEGKPELIEKLVLCKKFVVTEDVCPGVLGFLARKGEGKVLRAVCRRMGGVLKSETVADVLQTVWGKVKKVTKDAMCITDSILSCGGLPDPVDVGVEFSDRLTKQVKIHLLNYFYLRLLTRIEHPNPASLTAAGVPVPETLSHYLGALLDGSSPEFSSDTAYHPHIERIRSLTNYALTSLQWTVSLPGELTIFIGTPSRRSSAPVDIDSKDLTPGPLKQRATHVSQPVAKYSLVF